MKGLLLKDFISLKRQARILLLLLLFYGVFSIGQKDTGILQGVVVLLCIMMTLTSMAYDETVKWDRYALSLPVSRGTAVREKYVLGLLLDAAGSLAALLLSLLVCAFTGRGAISEVLLATLVMFGVGLLFLSLILPLLFRFGAEKGRMLMMAVIFLPVAVLLLLNQAGVSLPDLERWETLLGVLFAAAVVLFFLLSLWISTQIYSRKEF